MLSVNRNFNVVEGLIKGDEVEITSGLLQGVRGVVFEIENKNNLAISIGLLNRTVIVHLLDESVSGIHKSRNPSYKYISSLFFCYFYIKKYTKTL